MNPMHGYGNVPLNSTWNKKYFGLNYKENQNTQSMFNNIFPKILGVYKAMWKNMVRPNRPQITIHYGAGKM